MAMNRRDARELAFVLLFELDFQKEDPLTFYEQELALRVLENDAYVKDAVTGVMAAKEEIDALIEKYGNGWKVRRIPRVSVAILRLAIYELKYREDIPYSVSINEAVELCKKYSDEKAPAFVNGILNAVAEKEGLKN